MDLTGSIRCEDDERSGGRAQRPELWNRDLEFRQQFQQKPFELLVSAIDFVNQQNRGASARGIDGLQQRALDQECFAVEFTVRARAIERVRGIENPELQQLTRIIPLVQGMADVQTFVALKTDQLGAECSRRSRGERRLADTRFSLEKQRSLETKREKQRDRKA